MLEIRPDTAILVYKQTQAILNECDKLQQLSTPQTVDRIANMTKMMKQRIEDIDKIIGLVGNELWKQVLIKTRLLLAQYLFGVETKMIWLKDDSKKYESRKYDSRKTENTKNFETNKTKKQLNNSKQRLRPSVSPSTASLGQQKVPRPHLPPTPPAPPAKPRLHQAVFQHRSVLSEIHNETVVTIKMTQQQYLEFMKSVKQP